MLEHSNNNRLSWLKTDVSGFYDTISHEILFVLLEDEFNVDIVIINFYQHF
ncbi:MAG: hypothetical protein CM15mP112_00020 [Flavobacteriales bacterium]|nr:MAG: hypothetical protein CM15mP112_00020 [Flavobacteriales bacterium]